MERPRADGPKARPFTYLLLGAAFAVTSVALLGVAAAAADGRSTRTGAIDTGIVDQVNAVRSQAGLRPLRIDAGLTSAARAHSSEMLKLGYFSHDSANGGSMADRVRASYPAGAHWSVGENLLWSSPGIGRPRSVAIWMASQEHRSIILSAVWREVGCGAVHTAAAPGVYDGRPVTVVTCDFGVRG